MTTPTPQQQTATPRTDALFDNMAYQERRVCHGAEKLCRTLERDLAAAQAELAFAKIQLKEWVDAADAARQPEAFYEEYSERTMRAMQALLTKSRTDLAASEKLCDELAEASQLSMIAITGRCDRGDEPTENEKSAYPALQSALARHASARRTI